jgi:hypothetical protein
MKKLAKHITPRQLYIPAPPPDFTYRFTHLLFSCSNTPLLLLLISPSALTLSDLYFGNTSPECFNWFYSHWARDNIQTRPPLTLFIFIFRNTSPAQKVF